MVRATTVMPRGKYGYDAPCALVCASRAPAWKNPLITDRVRKAIGRRSPEVGQRKGGRAITIVKSAQQRKECGVLRNRKDLAVGWRAVCRRASTQDDSAERTSSSVASCCLVGVGAKADRCVVSAKVNHNIGGDTGVHIDRAVGPGGYDRSVACERAPGPYQRHGERQRLARRIGGDEARRPGTAVTLNE